jgi:hypothetical protein
MTLSPEYGSYRTTCENCLVTRSDESMPQEYDLTDTSGNVRPPSDPLSGRRTNFEVEAMAGHIHKDSTPSNPNTEVKILGSIAYMKAAGGRWPNPTTNTAMIALGNRTSSGTRIIHTITVVPPSYPKFSNIAGFDLGTTGTNNVVDHVTSIRGIGDDFGNFTVTNTSTGTSLAAVANPWTTTGAGANLCKRWVNGVMTTEPLWPWPMNQRIKDATASAGRYEGPCPGCVGGRFSRASTDVTADVEALLGRIPSQCRK